MKISDACVGVLMGLTVGCSGEGDGRTSSSPSEPSASEPSTSESPAVTDTEVAYAVSGTCVNFTGTLDQHASAGRVTVQSLNFIIFTIPFYFAAGTNEFLGFFGNQQATLYGIGSGKYSANAALCPADGGGGACLSKASQVVVLGDSYVNWPTHTFPQDLNRAAGQTFRMYAVGGYSLGSGGIGLIPPQFDQALSADPDITTVIMDGGGNDVLIPDTAQFPQGASCKNDTNSPNIPDCQKIVQKAIDAATALLLKGADRGVKDVVYFFYPHVPEGTLIGGAHPNAILDYALPKAKAFCDSALSLTNGRTKCHFVDMVPVFASHPEYFVSGDVHPNTQGSAAMAQAVWAKMQADCVAQPAGAACCSGGNPGTGGASGTGGAPSTGGSGGTGPGLDVIGTWGSRVKTAAKLTVPVLGTSDTDVDITLRLYVTKAGGQYTAKTEVCALTTTAKPDPNSLVLTYTPAAISTFNFTASEPIFTPVIGGKVPLPEVTIRGGMDASGTAVDGDADGNPGVTIPVKALGGVVVLDAYSGLTISIKLDATLKDAKTVTGTTGFSVNGKVFSSNSIFLGAGDITLIPVDSAVPFTANHFDGDVPCSSIVTQL